MTQETTMMHPWIMEETVRQHHAELIEQARRFRLGQPVPPEDQPAESRPRPSPYRGRYPQSMFADEINERYVGRLSVCETPRELTGERAR
jgi:hypothetical protein